MFSTKGLTGFQLKFIALCGMLFDHINTHFGTLLGFPLWFSWVGRFVAPVFLYLVMEGYQHTRNKKAYFNRLLIGAGIMYVINISHNLLIGNYHHPVTGEFDFFLLLNGNNIFQTLAVFFVLFVLVDRFKTDRSTTRWLNLLGVLGLLSLVVFSEGGVQLLPLALVMAFMGNSKLPVVWTLAITAIIWLGLALMDYSSFAYEYQTLYQYLTFENQFMQVLAIPLIFAYNGQRGGTGAKWEKNLFYIFYPVHLVVIYLVEMFF